MICTKPGQHDEIQKGVVKATDLEAWENAGLCQNGIDFFNTIKHRLEETAHAALTAGYQYTKQTWQALEWLKEGTAPELTLKPSVKGNKIFMYKPFGEAFQWFNTDTNDWELGGPNLVHSYRNHLKGKTSFDNYMPIYQSGDSIWLSTLSEWRLINLNRSFDRAVQATPRLLQVLANVKQDGNTVEQPLGWLHYAPQGRTAMVYTPLQELFYETSVTKWDEVEIQILELNNMPVSFQARSETFMILHFKQDTM